MSDATVTNTTTETPKPTEATLRQFSNVYNEGTKRKQLVIEECNSAENWYPITQAFKAGRARDIFDEPRVDKTPCFVLGSGASLDEALPQMKGWKGGILCSTSQALTLMYHGIEPTHIVCLDPFSLWDEIKGVDWSKTRTKLILNPGVMPDIVAKWPNDMLLYIQNNGKPDSYYATTQKRMYTWRDGPMRTPTFHFYIRTEMTIFACSPPMQMFCADKLGYGTVFLTGMNWSEYKGKRRSTEYTAEDGKWTAHPNPFTEDPDIIMSNNGKKTKAIHLYYKKNFLSAWRLSHQTLYNTDRDGIMTEVPRTDMHKVMQREGQNFPRQTDAMIDRLSERYLASVGAFIINTDHGVAFVESEDPEKELPQFMGNLLKQYKCCVCGIAGMSKDDADHEGEPCPCGKGKMTHTYNVDVEANMRRCRAHMALARARGLSPSYKPPESEPAQVVKSVGEKVGEILEKVTEKKADMEKIGQVIRGRGDLTTLAMEELAKHDARAAHDIAHGYIDVNKKAGLTKESPA